MSRRRVPFFRADRKWIISAFFYLLLLFLLFYPYSFHLIRALASHTIGFDEIFLYDHDWIQQGIPYYREFFRCVDNGNLFWSFNEFLGSEFYATKAVYVIGDPFAWAAYGLYRTAFHYLPTVLFVITGIKLLIAGLAFQQLIRRFHPGFAVSLLFGACYMLSGWAVIFLEQVYFLSFYALIPFALLGLEEIHSHQKYVLFWCASLFLLSTNLYLTWSLCFFMTVYWISRSVASGIEMKRFWKDSACIILVFLLAFCTAGLILLPAVSVLVHSPRLSARLIDYSFWSKTNICAILMNFFIPVIDGEKLLYHDYWYYFYQIGIYCGAFALLVSPQFLFQKRDPKEKRGYGILLAAALVSLLSPKIGILLNFSYSLRYTCYIAITLLLCAAVSLQQAPSKKAVFSEALLLLVLIGVLLFGTSGVSVPELWQYSEAGMLAASAGFIIAYAWLLLSGRGKTMQLLAVVLAIAEVLLFSSRTIATKTKNRVPAEYLSNADAITAVYADLREYDPSFYRVNLLDAIGSDVSVLPNSSMYYGIPALSGYDSVYNSALRPFLSWLGLYPDVAWNFRITDSRLFETLAAKYTIATPTTLAMVDAGAKKIDELSTESIYVFRNPEAEGALRSVGHIRSASVMDDLMRDIEGSRNAMIDLIQSETIVNDALASGWNNRYAAADERSFEVYCRGSVLYSDVTLSEDSLMQLAVPANEGWKVFLDGRRIETYSADGGFILFEVPSGAHHIELVYHMPMRLAGYVLSGSGLLVSIVLQAIVTKKRKQRT